MFSGKSSELQRQGKRHALAGRHVLYVKPKMDDRYSEDSIVTHDGKEVPAIAISDVTELLSLTMTSNTVILIDEVQFFDSAGAVMAINELIASGVDVIVFGLDMDRHGQPFGVVPYLMAIADEVNKFKAVCTHCGSDAWVSYGEFNEESQVVLGATEKYRPLCRTCYHKRTCGGNNR